MDTSTQLMRPLPGYCSVNDAPTKALPLVKETLFQAVDVMGLTTADPPNRVVHPSTMVEIWAIQWPPSQWAVEIRPVSLLESGEIARQRQAFVLCQAGDFFTFQQDSLSAHRVSETNSSAVA